MKAQKQENELTETAELETPEGESTEATETTAPSASELKTQAKDAVLAFAGHFEDYYTKVDFSHYSVETALENYIADTGIVEWILNLAKQIRSTTKKGLPLADQLRNIEAEIATHYSNAPIVEGKLAFDEDWEAAKTELLSKKRRITNAIAKANEQTTPDPAE